MLGAEMQQVIGLRLIGAANGHPFNVASLSAEKIDAVFKANVALATHILRGGDALGGAAKSLQVYTRKVRANRRRLIKRRGS